MNITNFIQFGEKDFDTSNGEGRVSTLHTDVDLIARPFSSSNDKAPTHQLYGKSPAGYEIEIGGIWKKKNLQGGDYYTLSIPSMNFNANLGRYPNQEDESLQAIIEWSPQNL
ncbi:MAG: DUF736 family protein [Chloroflexota bacterium]